LPTPRGKRRCALPAYRLFAGMFARSLIDQQFVKRSLSKTMKKEGPRKAPL